MFKKQLLRNDDSDQTQQTSASKNSSPPFDPHQKKNAPASCQDLGHLPGLPGDICHDVGEHLAKSCGLALVVKKQQPIGRFFFFFGWGGGEENLCLVFTINQVVCSMFLAVLSDFPELIMSFFHRSEFWMFDLALWRLLHCLVVSSTVGVPHSCKLLGVLSCFVFGIRSLSRFFGRIYRTKWNIMLESYIKIYQKGSPLLQKLGLHQKVYFMRCFPT